MAGGRPLRTLALGFAASPILPHALAHGLPAFGRNRPGRLGRRYDFRRALPVEIGERFENRGPLLIKSRQPHRRSEPSPAVLLTGSSGHIISATDFRSL